ncbi:uncharacterized protein LOC122655215 [Telopea speciosissima]|uniref:uncharacterized protein LOC122655215 n=1 Tax=Telopea speciosissima TaxID=54955 RepID=UPI001CC36E4F|nr:uncharacterized protein LOC122655215 [Telopea speciosissima]
MLQGEADLWWQTIKRILEGQLVTWAQFLKLFREKYFPITVRRAKGAEFIKLQQGSMTVTEYEKKFEELSRYVPHLVAMDVDKARLSESGLNNGIQRMVTALELNTYAEVVRRALLYEGPAKGTQKVESKWQGKRHFPAQGKKSYPPQKQQRIQYMQGASTIKAPESCPKCGKLHWSPCRFGTGVCLKCGKEGYLIKNCPLWNTQGKQQHQG